MLDGRFGNKSKRESYKYFKFLIFLLYRPHLTAGYPGLTGSTGPTGGGALLTKFIFASPALRLVRVVTKRDLSPRLFLGL